MQRYIALSLAVHVLAIGGWYSLDIQPEAGSGTRTIAMTLQAHATAAVNSRAAAPPESGAPHAGHTGQQTAPAKPAGKHPLAQQQRAASPATTTRLPLAGDSSPSTADAAAAATRTDGDTSRELAGPAPAVNPAAAADDMPARQALQSAVATAFRANFRYPRIARRNGWEGTVILALRVLPDGQLTDILVSSSSGHPVLDRAAVHTLQTASVPQAGQWLNGQACELVIPVEYHLLDS